LKTDKQKINLMNNDIGKILVVDDNDDVLQAAQLFLKKHFEIVRTENNPTKIPSILQAELFDVILLDMNFTRDATSGQEGFYWLNKTLQIDPSAVVVLITAYGDVGMAVRAVKEGAMDFVLKPWQNEKLLATISAAVSLRKSRLEANTLRQKQKQLSADMDQPFQNFIGTSPAMQKIFSTIQKVAKTDANVLILGGNGTGKELVARELHRQSLRSNEVFISLDMGAITETLFESELFGHVKGAFTDAKDDRAGRFEIASGGTLFLDEIGNIPVTLQAKLLTALQNRQITRVGSNKPIPIDIRLICATNLPINELVNQKQFRQDILYRINTIEIHLPTLHERIEDIPLLTNHFLDVYCKKYHLPLKEISSSTLDKLKKYHWPGNVRELQHTIERAVILSEEPLLKPTDIFLASSQDKIEGLILDKYNLEEVEKLIIQKVIEKHQGNISRAAEELGLTRTSLYRRMERYGL
jgi:DNA-binding NtrC family response regulator